MQCKVITCDGATYSLPQLLSWQLLRTDGDGCDGFCVCFAADAKTDGWLAKAVKFSASEGNRQVFCGIVDDYELELGSQGTRCTLSGRGMAGRLLDNEVRPAEYQQAYLSMILERYVHAYGISSKAVSLPPLSLFSVPLGTSCWNVLRGFCINAGGRPPWCSADGVVQVATQYPYTGKGFTEEQLLSATYCNCRYGVISRQLHITPEGTVFTATNDAFIAIGGSAQKVRYRAGSTLSCNYRSPNAQIADSRTQQFRLKLELPGNFLAEPNTWVSATVPTLGISGNFRVCQCLSEGRGKGVTCTLILSRV